MHHPSRSQLGRLDALGASVGNKSFERAAVLREAAEQGKTAAAHFAHLVVHGMLHLQGYDHETDADARIMEQTEREILGRLGYPDPY